MASSEVDRVFSGLVSDENNEERGGDNKAVVPEATGSTDLQKTSPDSLKNTPSNIAKLEDVIEHCEGRQKYLAQTRSPSDGGDVRWYFCKVPLADKEVAASVPGTEIVGKGEYFRFGMRDSLAIEASFLQREEELLSSWWKEYAECSEGPRERSGSSKNSNEQLKESSSEGAKSAKLCEVEEERVGVPVKGGLYEVDLVKRHCFPVYWYGENRRVLRGHWFARKGGLDWLPLREDVAEQLEIAYRNQVWHRRTFQPSGLFAARVDIQGSTPGLHALFTGEDNTWEARLNVDASGFSSVIGLGGNGIMLRRGYATSHSPKPTQDELRQQKEEEMDDYCSQVPVRHLVFMVHGIGQRLEKSNLVDDVGNFRHITASLAERHLTSHQLGTQRVLFIPCQWRKGLKLSGEAAVEKITLDGVRGLRVMLGATVHDVLYYMSPIYCQDIINSVSNQLNRLYLKFLGRNPGYDGKVSLYGHSLGSVLSYDILCHQETLSSPFPMECMYRESAKIGELPCDMKNGSSTSDSLRNLEARNSTPVYETEDNTNLIHEGLTGEQQTFVLSEGSTEHSSAVMDPVTSDMDGNIGALNCKKESGEKDACESSADEATNLTCRFTVSPEKFAECKDATSKDEGLDEATNLTSGFTVVSDKVAEECKDATSNEEIIKSLREEVDHLKKKVAELEWKCSGSNANGELGEGKLDSLSTVLKEPSSGKLPAGQDEATRSYTPYIKYTKLEFKVDTFFAVGSPLGVFLALRNIRIGIGKGQDYWDEENIIEEMPACRQMFNIFHPFDPVAYRIEPLVCKEYISKRPVIIPYHRGGRRLHIGFQELSEDLAARSRAIMDHLHSVRVRVLTVCQSRKADGLGEGAEDSQEKEERSYGSLMIQRLTGNEGGRIDHTLQDKTFEHPYLQAIGSHTNYWRDHDTALFILRHLYRDIPEDPGSPTETSENSKDETGSAGWSDQKETVDEELPLTFSDRAIVRNFSRKAKRIMKH